MYENLEMFFLEIKICRLERSLQREKFKVLERIKSASLLGEGTDCWIPMNWIDLERSVFYFKILKGVIW